MIKSDRSQQIIVFIFAGAVGFLIEAVTIHVGITIFSTDPQSPRFVSYPIALVWTWYINRTYGFRMKGVPNFHEFSRFVQSNLASQITNLFLYFVLTSHIMAMASKPVLALVIATIISTCVSFLLYRIYAFRKQ